MQIAVELPNEFVNFHTLPKVMQEMPVSYALWLFQRERITLARAAELAGMGLYDFMAICKESRIPVIDISREDLLDELAALNPT